MSKRISNLILALAFVSALLCSIDASAASNSISDAFVATEISAAIDTVKTMTPEEAAANRRSTIISYIKASAKDTDIDKEGKSTFFVAVLNDSILMRPTRPKIGLVLSGGGAKGSAHIGVLKLIEEYGIPIDCVAGTSMGSIIGGLYALGYSPDEMQEIISNIDWGTYMTDRIAEKSLSYQERLNRAQYLVEVPFSIRAKSSVSLLQTLPGGFVSGNKLENLFNRLCYGYQGDINFDDLPRQFACVATDIVSGREIVLRKGNLPKAIRSSMAIPGVFVPVRMGDMVLVDGGLKNNMPVDICRQMGADIVIGSMVGSEVKGNTPGLTSISGVLGSIMGVVTMGRNEENIKDCNVFVKPDITGYGMLSFTAENIAKLVSEGYRAASTQSESLGDIREIISSWGPIDLSLKAPKATLVGGAEDIALGEITILGVSPEEVEWLLIKSRLKKRVNTNISGRELEDRIEVMYGTNNFSKVIYYLEENPVTHRSDLTIVCDEKASDGLSMAFRLDTQEASSVHLKFGINTHRITSPQFDVSGILGYNPKVTISGAYSHIYLPKINVSASFKKYESMVSNYGNEYATARFMKHEYKFFFSEAYSRYIAASLGIQFDQFVYGHAFTDNNYSESLRSKGLAHPYLGAFAHFAFDNRNSMYFTKRGVLLDISSTYRFLDFKQRGRRFGDVMFRFEGYIPLGGRVMLSPRLYSRVLFGKYSDCGPYSNIPGYAYFTPNDGYEMAYANYMGSLMPGKFIDQQLPFFGINNPEEMYNNLAVAMLELRVNVYRKHYISAIGSFAREAFTFADFFKPATMIPYSDVILYTGDEMTALNHWGAGLLYSFKSIAGPIRAGLAYSDVTKRVCAFVSLGLDF